MPKIQLVIIFCILPLKMLSSMSCVAEEINNSSIENYCPPNKDGTIMLNDEIILVGNCTLSHNLELKANGKISIANNAHLIITKEEIELITISGIKQDNLIFESQSSTIDIDAFTKFSCDEIIKHTVGTLHVYRQAVLIMRKSVIDSLFHDFLEIGPCWYPFCESFKVYIDKKSYGLLVDGVTIGEGTFDHLEKCYGK